MNTPNLVKSDKRERMEKQSFLGNKRNNSLFHGGISFLLSLPLKKYYIILFSCYYSLNFKILYKEEELKPKREGRKPPSKDHPWRKYPLFPAKR